MRGAGLLQRTESMLSHAGAAIALSQSRVHAQPMSPLNPSDCESGTDDFEGTDEELAERVWSLLYLTCRRADLSPCPARYVASAAETGDVDPTERTNRPPVTERPNKPSPQKPGRSKLPWMVIAIIVGVVVLVLLF